MVLFENHPYFLGGYWEHRTELLIRYGCDPESPGLQLRGPVLTNVYDAKSIKTNLQSKRTQRIIDALGHNSSLTDEQFAEAMDAEDEEQRATHQEKICTRS